MLGLGAWRFFCISIRAEPNVYLELPSPAFFLQYIMSLLFNSCGSRQQGLFAHVTDCPPHFTPGGALLFPGDCVGVIIAIP